MNGPARQQGIALFVSLMFMVILTIIGVASVRTSTLDLRLAQNFQFRTIAFQFAETAIVRVMGNADMETIHQPRLRHKYRQITGGYQGRGWQYIGVGQH